jgi:predicted transcriptional regulator
MDQKKFKEEFNKFRKFRLPTKSKLAKVKIRELEELLFKLQREKRQREQLFSPEGRMKKRQRTG